MACIICKDMLKSYVSLLKACKTTENIKTCQQNETNNSVVNFYDISHTQILFDQVFIKQEEPSFEDFNFKDIGLPLEESKALLDIAKTEAGGEFSLISESIPDTEVNEECHEFNENYQDNIRNEHYLDVPKDIASAAVPITNTNGEKICRIVSSVRRKRHEMHLCHICPYMTKNKSSLTAHLLVHHWTGICKVCQFRTKDRLTFQDHECIHDADAKIETYMCETCGYMTKRKPDFNKHVQKHVSEADVVGIEIYECQVCGFQTIDEQNFSKHSLIHKPILTKKKRGKRRRVKCAVKAKVYKCELCIFETKKMCQLLKHRRWEHKDDVQVCEICTYRPINRKNFEKHLLIHMDYTRLEMLRCGQCSYKTIAPDGLKRHLRVHDLKVYKCKTCQFQTRCHKTINTHVQFHAATSELKTYQCHTCGFISQYKHRIRQHVSIHSSKSEICRCALCTFETTDKELLEKHILGHKYYWAASGARGRMK